MAEEFVGRGGGEERGKEVTHAVQGRVESAEEQAASTPALMTVETGKEAASTTAHLGTL